MRNRFVRRQRRDLQCVLKGHAQHGHDVIGFPFEMRLRPCRIRVQKPGLGLRPHGLRAIAYRQRDGSGLSENERCRRHRACEDEESRPTGTARLRRGGSRHLKIMEGQEWYSLLGWYGGDDRVEWAMTAVIC